jgi:chromosome segregation ATPase
MSYEDDTLIRLRRQYSKDETVAALSKKLSEADYKNGELQSEIDELKHLLEQSENLLKISNKENNKLKQNIEKTNESFKHTFLYKYQKRKIKTFEENFECKKIESQKLHDKIYSLNAEILTLK